MPYKVMIVEDNEEERIMLNAMVNAHPDFDLVGLFDSVEEVKKFLEQKIRIDLGVVDLNLFGDMDGFLIMEMLLKQYPQIKVVVHTLYEDGDLVFKAIRSGAMGYLLKTESPTQLLNGLEGIMKGQVPISPRIARKIMTHIRGDSDPEPLTPREGTILSLVSQGFTYTQISKKLDLSRNTVYSHVKNIYLKLQVNSKGQALVRAKELNLI